MPEGKTFPLLCHEVGRWGTGCLYPIANKKQSARWRMHESGTEAATTWVLGTRVRPIPIVTPRPVPQNGPVLQSSFYGARRWFLNLLGVLMKLSRKLPIVFALGCLCLVLMTVPAYGYTDPNTVGLLSQILTPLLITAGACLTFLRKSIVDVFAGITRRFRRRSDV
jgi:hypothetical protein